MIPNITRGGNMAGLLSYLAGDGRRDEHEDQHIVAGDEATVTFFGYDALDRATALAVAAELDAPRRAFGREVTRQVTVADPEGGAPIQARVPASVWHASLSLHADEGQLSDEKWAAIADDFVDAMGFSETESKAPCRWVAIRHGVSSNGNDHIHIAVSLVREDGTKASTFKDFRRAQNAARDLERKYGLGVLESRENDLGERGVKPAELARAQRAGDVEVDSRRLDRLVRGAATASFDEAEFVRRLHQHGVLIRPRFAAGRDDVVAGYSVALHPAQGGRAAWYGGGRLAKDLTLPRLRSGWTDSVEASNEAVAEWQATFRNPWRYRPFRMGREAQEVSPVLAAKFADEIGLLRAQLKNVPTSDRSTWAHAARDAAGVFAAWSARMEPTPGPLAATARSLARSAHIPAHQAHPRPMNLQSISGAAALLSLADPRLSSSAAAAMLVQQLGRTVVAIMDAHLAAGEAQRAQQIAETMRTHVNGLRDALPPVAITPARPASGSQELDRSPVRSGRPLRPAQSMQRAGWMPPTHRGDLTDRGR